MSVKTFLTVCTLICLFQSAFAQVDRARLERTLRTLASDEMEGRKAGTDAEKRAARFIAEQFKQAGLVPMKGAKDFFQPFTKWNVTPTKSSLSLNGQALPAGDFKIVTTAKHLTKNDLEGITIFRIGSMEDLMKSRSHKGSKLVIFPSAWGPRVRSFIASSPSEYINEEDRDQLSVVAILDATNIDAIALEVENAIAESPMLNVVGILPGSDEALGSVMFSAHFDHIGRLEAKNGDDIANGADDDASGVTALVELAHHFKALGTPKRTLIFAAFTGEELGGFGSTYMSKHIDPATIAAGINIEMIGKLSKFGSGQGFITGFDKSSLPGIMSKAVEASAYKLHPDPYPEQQLFYRSDNAVFAAIGVPAHTVGSGQIDKDDYYHTVDDEIETLNMDHLEAMIRAIAMGAKPIVDGTETPTRIPLGGPSIGGH